MTPITQLESLNESTSPSNSPKIKYSFVSSSASKISVSRDILDQFLFIEIETQIR